MSDIRLHLAKIAERGDAHAHRCGRLRRGVGLFLILGYLVWNGGKSLNWDFFTKLPKPVGETGGGMANAIVGSLKLLFLAAVIGLPVGLMAGVYLAEFGGKTFSFVIALHHRPAERRAFDRDRHFRLFAGGAAGKAFLGTGGRSGAGSHGDPDHRAQHRRISARRSGEHARRGHGSGRQQMEDDRDRDSARRERRHHHRNAALAWPAWRAKPRRCSSRRSAIAFGARAGTSRSLRSR